MCGAAGGPPVLDTTRSRRICVRETNAPNPRLAGDRWEVAQNRVPPRKPVSTWQYCGSRRTPAELRANDFAFRLGRRDASNPKKCAAESLKCPEAPNENPELFLRPLKCRDANF